MSGQTRRTKAQKLKTVEKRQDQFSYTYTSPSHDAIGTPITKAKNIQHPANSVTALFKYDVNLVYKDLVKTLIITGLILTCLIGPWIRSGNAPLG